jgi:hypothetical protein
MPTSAPHSVSAPHSTPSKPLGTAGSMWQDGPPGMGGPGRAVSVGLMGGLMAPGGVTAGSAGGPQGLTAGVAMMRRGQKSSNQVTI